MSKEPTLVQKLNALQDEIASLKTEKDSLAAEYKNLKAEADTAATAKNELAAEISRHGDTKVALALMESEFGKVKAELEAVKADFDAKVTETASRKAAEVVAAQGVPPVKSDVEDTPTKTDVKAAPKTGLARFADAAAIEAGPLYAKANGLKLDFNK